MQGHDAPSDSPRSDRATPGPAPRDLIEEGLALEKGGLLDRALQQYRAAIELADDPAITADALCRQSHVHRSRCAWDDALKAARESAEAARTAGCGELLAEAWNAEAAVHQSRGELDLAASLYDRMLEVAAAERPRGVALLNRATIHAMQDDMVRAERCFREAYACFERAEYEWGMAFALNNLGRLELNRLRPLDAQQVLRAALRFAKRINDLDLLALVRLNYAESLMLQGDLETAEIEASASIGHYVTAENDFRRTEVLRLLGDISRRKGDVGAARRFFGAGMRIAEALGARVERDVLAARIEELDASVATARDEAR